MSHATIALVIAQPGPLRDSLVTLLSTLPEIEIVAEARDLSTLNRIREDWQPDIILLEASCLKNGFREALQQIGAVWDKSRTMMLVDSIKQQRLADTAGFDAAYVKGSQVSCLIDIVQTLLSPERKQTPQQ